MFVIINTYFSVSALNPAKRPAGQSLIKWREKQKQNQLIHLFVNQGSDVGVNWQPGLNVTGEEDTSLFWDPGCNAVFPLSLSADENHCSVSRTREF